MKQIKLILICTILVFAVASTASAIPFSVTHDYALHGTYQNQTYQAIYDIGNRIDWVDTFVFPAVDPEAETITSATFSITHVGNIVGTRNAEFWLVTDQGGQSIGNFSQSVWGSWTTDTFELSDSVIDTMMASNPWSLGIKISEETDCFDWLLVDKATFAGDYTPVNGSPVAPVPEPATMLLLGTGLAGMAAAGRRRKARKD